MMYFAACSGWEVLEEDGYVMIRDKRGRGGGGGLGGGAMPCATMRLLQSANLL